MLTINHIARLDAAQAAVQQQLPDGFVYLDNIDPTIAVDLRYFGHDNFVGRPIDGYHQSGRAIMTRPTAEALAQVQAVLRRDHLGLKIYDAYRPQRAVDDFVLWSSQSADCAMQERYYPRVDKTQLFDEGYISKRSGHTRGSTVDITIIPFSGSRDELHKSRSLAAEKPLNRLLYSDTSIDMGTPFNFFDSLAHTDSPEIAGAARENRDLLRRVMHDHGFFNHPKEWWHYTLVDEPFPGTYFNFEVR